MGETKAVLKECPYCHAEIDRRGYTQHVRKCKEQHENQEQGNDEEQPAIENGNESNESDDMENALKNRKTPLVTKVITSIVGVSVAVLTLILMLKSTTSQESKMKESQKETKSLRRRRL